MILCTGNDSSDEESGEEVEDEGRELGGEVRGEMIAMIEGVTTLTDALNSLTINSPVCHPDRPNKVYIYSTLSSNNLALMICQSISEVVL